MGGAKCQHADPALLIPHLFSGGESSRFARRVRTMLPRIPPSQVYGAALFSSPLPTSSASTLVLAGTVQDLAEGRSALQVPALHGWSKRFDRCVPGRGGRIAEGGKVSVTGLLICSRWGLPMLDRSRPDRRAMVLGGE